MEHIHANPEAFSVHNSAKTKEIQNPPFFTLILTVFKRCSMYYPQRKECDCGFSSPVICTADTYNYCIGVVMELMFQAWGSFNIIFDNCFLTSVGQLKLCKVVVSQLSASCLWANTVITILAVPMRKNLSTLTTTDWFQES